MSEVKVNKISPRTACGTVTLGDSGDTFTIPSGATITNAGTASGFGATGAVSWNTTKITADPGPAVTGTGYFCDTSGGAFTVTLPASPSAGDVIGVSDYAKTFDTNNLTLGRNSKPIGGVADDAVLSTEGAAVTLVYVDGTKGWIVTDSGTQSDAPIPTFITATGGNQPTAGGCVVDTDYKYHRFTGPGTFTVTCGGNAAGSNSVDYIIVAGGGGGAGGNDRGAAGGAGGFVGSSGAASGCYAAGCAPLVGPVGAFCVSASPGAYAIVVGGGGAGAPCSPGVCSGTVGVASSAFCVSVAGGGYGGGRAVGGNGGSGGGGGEGCFAGGSGNTPTLSPPQGRNGGIGGGPVSNGGGGGVSGLGGDATGPQAGPGGQDINNSITGSPVYYAGGGGGGAQQGTSTQGAASPGGSGGAGGAVGGSPPHCGVNGTAYTGGGGGGASNRSGGHAAGGGNGGDGVVIIRYKFQ